MKTRIFIGSSSEGLEVANYVKEYLSKDFECLIWTDNIFKYNTSYLDTLLTSASLFDFGILIATKDDYLETRKKSFDAPRDNIIFEFGLFIGRLGTSRAFVLQEKDTKLPSDLLGISVPSFEKCADLTNSVSLNQSLERVTETIKEKISLGELGLLPSTVLAIGYFFNFIKIVSETLLENPILEVEGNKFTNFELNIVIPKDLDADLKKRSTIYFRRNSLKQIQLDCKSRSFPVYVTYDENKLDKLRLYDMPTTLNGIDKAIEMYLRKGHIGKTTQQTLLEEMELRNFRTTLQNLIANDSFCRDIVNLIAE